jgi:hypothetical protein
VFCTENLTLTEAPLSSCRTAVGKTLSGILLCSGNYQSQVPRKQFIWVSLFLFMKSWTVEYNNHIFKVETHTSYSQFFIDGRLVDSQRGSMGAVLMSKIDEGKPAMAILNFGQIKTFCYIYVDFVQIFSSEKL